MDYSTFFARYGTVVSAQVQRDPVTGRSRGFGFVTFADKESCDKVIAEPNLSLDGRKMEIKYAVPKGQVGSYDDSSSRFASSTAGGRPKKIYIAGISAGVSEEDLKEHFAQFGRVVECYIQKDRNTGESRGFAFLTFENPDSVDKVLQKPSQQIGDKCTVDVKIARPKGETGRPGGDWSTFGGGGGGSWGGGFASPAPGYAPSWGGSTGLDSLGVGLGSTRASDDYGSSTTGLGGLGSGLPTSTGPDYSQYSQTGYYQNYGYGGLGASGGTGATPGYGDTSTLRLNPGYGQWAGQTTLDDTKRVYDPTYGTGGSAYGTGGSTYGTSALTGATPSPGTASDPTGQYTYGALQGRRATVRATYHPYSR